MISEAAGNHAGSAPQPGYWAALAGVWEPFSKCGRLSHLAGDLGCLYTSTERPLNMGYETERPPIYDIH